MEYLNVLVAAAGSFGFGAVWYTVLSKPWLKAAGIECDADGKPVVKASPVPFIYSAICMILVAGFLRHIYAMSGVTSVADGALGGFGIGLFFISPWVMMNYGYAGRPFNLTLLDSGYAVIGCTIIGTILNLF